MIGLGNLIPRSIQSIETHKADDIVFVVLRVGFGSGANLLQRLIATPGRLDPERGIVHEAGVGELVNGMAHYIFGETSGRPLLTCGVVEHNAS